MTDLQIEIMKAKIDLWRQATEIQFAAYNAQIELYKHQIDDAIAAAKTAPAEIETPELDIPELSVIDLSGVLK